MPPEYDRVLHGKDAKRQARIFQAMQRMDQDMGHPGLQVRKLQGRKDVWYARASRADRITFYRSGGKIILIMNCGHEIL